MDGSLGATLRRLRDGRGLSLRDVEELTGLSNGYLSLLENDKVKHPKPPVLYKLAEALGASYPELMERAGYVPPADGHRAGRTASPPVVAFKGAEKLTEGQREEVQDFIYFKLRQLGREGRREPQE